MTLWTFRCIFELINCTEFYMPGYEVDCMWANFALLERRNFMMLLNNGLATKEHMLKSSFFPFCCPSFFLAVLSSTLPFVCTHRKISRNSDLIKNKFDFVRSLKCAERLPFSLPSPHSFNYHYNAQGQITLPARIGAQITKYLSGENDS